MDRRRGTAARRVPALRALSVVKAIPMRILDPDGALGGRASGRSRLVPAGAGETVHVLVDSATVKVGVEDTAGTLSMIEVTLSAGGGVPDHVHARDDETMYVLEGSLDVRVGDEHLALGAGGCAFAPRGTVHGFSNPGFATARLLLIASPAVEPQRAFLELAAGFAVGVPTGRVSPARGDGGALESAFRALAAAGDVTLETPAVGRAGD
ncbi:MAG: cupin domain-containing protein [Gemmatirosa sp.]